MALRFGTLSFWVAASVVASASASCGQLLGVSDDDVPPTVSPEASAPPQDGESAVRDGSQSVVVPDPSDAACPGFLPGRSQTAVATRSTFVPTTDAALEVDLSKFASPPAFELDVRTAAHIRGCPKATAKVYIEWDSGSLHLGIAVRDSDPQGAHIGADLYMNDGVEIFVSGIAENRVGDYTPSDLHYAIAHNGALQDYSNIHASQTVPGKFARAVSGGYEVELTIPASRLGRNTLTANMMLAVDVQIIDGYPDHLIWAMEPHATCPSCSAACACNYSPAYDTLTFAPLRLAP